MIAGFAERVGAKGVWAGRNPRGLPVRMSYERLPEAGWMVSVGMTEEAFRAPLIRSTQWLAAISALIILVAILLLVPLVRQRLAFQRAVAEAQGRLRLSEERLALALDSGDDGLFDWDLVSDAVWLSPRWSVKLGYAADAPTRPGALYAESVHPDDREEVAALMQAHLAGTIPAIEAEYRRRCADGHYLWVLLRARVVERDAAGHALRIVGTLMDISRRKEAELHVIHLAHHDTLTGLANRALFHQRLSEVLERSRRGSARYAVLACDLDRFKAVNDTFGHAEGDRLLCTVAERICAVMSPQDTVARLGGDEFAVILGEVPDDGAIDAACERIIAAIGAPMPHHGGTIDIAVSIGVALVSGGEATAEEVFRQADMAMYQAKAAGRNTYCRFEATVLTRNSTRGLLALDMKDAIRRGDFFLVYQPVIDVVSGAVVSFEALMRWQHPTRGMISPADFIPVAEETGMIAQLGAWALVEACREALTWDEDLWIGVNVSPVQFRCGLEQAVLTALATTGLPAGRLKLEVTEGVLMQDADGAIACLHRLRALGVRIALDDFGTGYSSLSYLRRFPFDKLKIDRAFIRDITEPDAAAIIRAVVGIGQSLGMSIVAEGRRDAGAVGGGAARGLQRGPGLPLQQAPSGGGGPRLRRQPRAPARPDGTTRRWHTRRSTAPCPPTTAIDGRVSIAGQAEAACRALFLAPDEALVATAAAGRAGQDAICYLDAIGALPGRIGGRREDGFVLHLSLTRARAARVAARLLWQAEQRGRPVEQRATRASSPSTGR